MLVACSPRQSRFAFGLTGERLTHPATELLRPDEQLRVNSAARKVAASIPPIVPLAIES
jgi:hypothetical protein